MASAVVVLWGQDPNNVPIEFVREIKPCFARPENSFLHTIKHIKLHLMDTKILWREAKTTLCVDVVVDRMYVIDLTHKIEVIGLKLI